MAPWRAAALGVTLAVLWLAVGPRSAAATHGGAGLPLVVESERVSTVETKACSMVGKVRNPNSVAVIVRLVWRASDPAGTSLGLATARLSRLAPGERRAFVSSPFTSLATGLMLPACASVPRIERVEAAADRAP